MSQNYQNRRPQSVMYDTSQVPSIEGVAKVLLGALILDPAQARLHMHELPSVWFKDVNGGQLIQEACKQILERGTVSKRILCAAAASLDLQGINAEAYVDTSLDAAVDTPFDMAVAAFTDAYMRRAHYIAHTTAARAAATTDVTEAMTLYRSMIREMQAEPQVKSHTEEAEVFERAMAMRFSGEQPDYITKVPLQRMTNAGLSQFEPGDMVVIAADTGNGKTQLALQMFVQYIEAGATCYFYALEMSASQLMQRIFSMLTGVSYKADFTLHEPTQIQGLQLKVQYIKQKYAPFIIDGSSMSSAEAIAQHIMAMNAKHGIVHAAFIDYLQLCGGDIRLIREQQVAQMSRLFRLTGLLTKTTMFALSQLRREKPTDLPTLNRIRESGAVAQDATHVLMTCVGVMQDGDVFRAMTPDEKAPFSGTSVPSVLCIEKAREGGLGKVVCDFDYRTGFCDVRETATPLDVW